MVLERVYTVGLSKLYALGRHRERARKAMKYLRRFVARHMKTTEDKVVLGTDVNEFVWKRGIQKPPRKVKIRCVKDDDGTTLVSLEVEGKGEQKKVAKEEKGKEKKKKEEKAEEKKEKKTTKKKEGKKK